MSERIPREIARLGADAADFRDKHRSGVSFLEMTLTTPGWLIQVHRGDSRDARTKVTYQRADAHKKPIQ